MKAGQLRKRLTIDAPSMAQDAHGQDIPTYVAMVTVWGSIKPLSSQQLALSQANVITALATHQIRIRYRNDIKIGFHRIRYGTGPAPLQACNSIGYETLTASQYAGLPIEGSGSGGNGVSTPRYFTINSIIDPDELHNELVLTCTELKA